MTGIQWIFGIRISPTREFGAGWTQLQNSADKTCTLIKRRRGCWEVSLLFRSQPLKKDVKKKAHCEPDLLNSDLVTEEHHCHFLQTREWTSVPTGETTLKAHPGFCPNQLQHFVHRLVKST